MGQTNILIVKTIEENNESVVERLSNVDNLTIEERIELKCHQYGIEPDIPLAIARLETGHFTSRAFKEGNNVGGLSINEKPMSFDTLEDGIEAFVQNLANNYFAEGLDTVEEIGTKYCPVNKENWIRIVNQLLEEYK